MVILSEAEPGREGIVASLRTTDSAIANKLFAMGIMPGVSIVVEQRFPSFIVKVGRTRAALDRNIAQVIYLY